MQPERGDRLPARRRPGRFDSGELGYGPTISSTLYSTGNGDTLPITAAAPVPAPLGRTAVTFPGLVKIVSNGCVGTATWKTPKNLTPGLYTYFCRIHPFMRGAFRVTPGRSSKT